MMLDDDQLAHLASAVDLPDLSGTPYELRGEIGRGGMGVVYRAFDRKLAREVALKVTEAAEAASEARVAAGLEHPGIVPVYDSGGLPDGRGFYTMRLIEGEPLDAYAGNRTGLALPARLAIFLKVCEAAGFAHSRGIVHRDLKPGNVMIGAFGEVAVLDWGVAAAAGGGGPAKAAGTPAFMAPEQAAGGPATAAADIYSLGAMLEFLLGGDERAPRPLRAIAAKAMAAAPDARYATAADLAAEITRFQDGAKVEAYRETAWERAARFASVNRTLLLLVAAYFVARIFVFAVWRR